jgi:hypothetical protein
MEKDIIRIPEIVLEWSAWNLWENLKTDGQTGVDIRIPHSTGEKIRANEDIAEIYVRWAVTDRPSAAEEELHRQYKAKFGQLPQYTVHT